MQHKSPLQHYRDPINRRWFFKFGASCIASALAVLQSCTRRAESTPESSPAARADEAPVVDEAPEPQILRVAFSLPPAYLDPAFFITNVDAHFGLMVYDGLVWVDPKLTPQPMLAESWEQSADLLSWTFHLRQDVTFHHDTPFTAQDVVYTFERLLDPEIGSRLRSVLSFVASIEAVDDYIVRFDLQTPNVDLPLLLGAAQARIIPHDYDLDLLSAAPSGTGPFRLKEFVPGQRTLFIHNGAYWDVQRHHLAEVHHIYLSSLDEQVAALVANEVDLVPDIGSATAELLTDNPEIRILEAPSGAYQTIVMQATKPPFTDVRVRQALKYCVDRPAMVSRVLQGHGTAAHDHPVAPISPFWTDEHARSRDIVQARQLLADAGYTNGIELDLITSNARPGMVELAEAFREMAAPAGVAISVVEVPADVYWNTYWTNVPFHISSWNLRPNIDETFMVSYHSRSVDNESKWSSPALDEWIDTARAEPDPDQRKVLYQQAQQLLMDEGAVIIPYFRSVLTAARKTVQDFTPHPAAWLDLRDVKIETIKGSTGSHVVDSVE